MNLSNSIKYLILYIGVMFLSFVKAIAIAITKYNSIYPKDSTQSVAHSSPHPGSVKTDHEYSETIWSHYRG